MRFFDPVDTKKTLSIAKKQADKYQKDIDTYVKEANRIKAQAEQESAMISRSMDSRFI